MKYTPILERKRPVVLDLPAMFGTRYGDPLLPGKPEDAKAYCHACGPPEIQCKCKR